MTEQRPLPGTRVPNLRLAERPNDRRRSTGTEPWSRGRGDAARPCPLGRWAALLAPTELVGGDGGRWMVDLYAASCGTEVRHVYPALFDGGLVHRNADRLVRQVRDDGVKVLVVPVVGALGEDVWDATAVWAALRGIVDVHACSGSISASSLIPPAMAEICRQSREA